MLYNVSGSLGCAVAEVISSGACGLIYCHDRLEENGQTALGPALVISILLAARSSGSQVSANK